MPQEIMKKLNTMGESRQPRQNTARYGGGQIINVTYGHNGSGKLYSYRGSNKRVGDIVTPEVTHPKSGKTYRTLAVVRSTHTLPQGQDTIDYLDKKDINMKTIGRTDQTSLPGYKKYKDHGGVEAWKKEAQAAYDLKLETRLDDSIPPMQKMNLYRMINNMRRK